LQTDRRTDRLTDKILIARPRLHSMQRGKNEFVGVNVAPFVPLLCHQNQPF